MSNPDGVENELRWVRWAPAVVLVTEALALSYAFDIQQIAVRQAWWTGWHDLGSWLPLGFLALTGLVAATGKRLLEIVDAQSASRQLRWTAISLLTTGVVFFLSSRLHDTEAPASGLWSAAWAVALVTWIGVGLHSLMPIAALGATVRHFPRLALAGLATGMLSYGAGRLVIENWHALSPMTLVGVGLVLWALGQRPWRGEGLVVGLDDFSVSIAPECSGVEGMGLLGAFLLGFIAIFHRRIKVGRSLALIPFALVASALLNSARIALLLLIGAGGYPQVALMGFHSKAGWVFFSLIALSAVLLMGSSRFMRADDGSAAMSPMQMETDLLPERGSPTSYLLPILALTFVGLLTESLAAAVDHLYVLRIIVALLAFLWVMPRSQEFRVDRISGLGGVGAGVIGFLAWVWLLPHEPERAAALRSTYEALPQTRYTLELGARLLGAALVVPLVEELAFRGYLMRRLRTRDFDEVDYKACGVYSLLVSSFVFGALHASAWIPATLCGLLYGAVAVTTGKLSGAVIAHATTNALIGGAVVLFGRFDLL